MTRWITDVNLIGVVSLALCVLSLGAPASAGQPFEPEFARDSAVCLNGAWRVLAEHGDEDVWKPEVAQTVGPWREVVVPGPFMAEAGLEDRRQLGFMWATRTFSLSPAEAARDAVLKWNGICFGATVWLNEQFLTTYVPKGPHTVLLPRGLLRAGENRLVMKLPGWAGVAKGEAGYPLIPGGPVQVIPGSKAPTIYDDIWIEFYDRAYLKWIHAVPDIENGAVKFRIWLDGIDALPPTVDITAEVARRRGEGLVGEVAAEVRSVESPAEITVPLAEVELWTPESPELYVATLRAAVEGRVCDEVTFRFGLRDISVVDGHYQLNGKPIWFRGSNLVFEWLWGGDWNREIKRYLVDEARNMNLNSFRTHTLPLTSSWASVADEHGMMIWAELPVCYNYRDFQFTPKEKEIFHQNCLLDATGWVTRLWNHPSIMMWVLSNESRRDNEWEAGPFRYHVRTLDPTRPTLRTGETEIGTPESIDMHACWNYGGATEGGPLNQFAREANRKDPRRTLSNSEYMNYLGGKRAATLRWLGAPDHPDADLNFAEFAMEHTEAMRRLNFDGILPYMYAGWPRFRNNNWRPDYPTPIAASLHSSMAPVLASLDLFDRNYRAGEEVTTTLHLINELHEEAPVQIDLYVTPEHPLFVPDAEALEASVSRQSFARVLEPASIAKEDIRWRVPEKEGQYYLAAVVRREGDAPVVSQRTIRALAERPAVSELKGRTVAVLGGDGVIEEWLRERGVRCAASWRPGQTAADVLLVWEVERVSPEARSAAAQILDWVEAGGRLVILEQSSWDWKELVDFEVGEGISSRAFPYEAVDHPMLDGVDPEYLKRWNSLPGTIADGCLRGPAAEAGRPLIWIEEPGETVALSLPRGRGEILVSLLHVKERVDPSADGYDPVASRMLENMLLLRR